MSGKSVFECIYFMRLLVLMWIHRCVLLCYCGCSIVFWMWIHYVLCTWRCSITCDIGGGKAVYRWEWYRWHRVIALYCFQVILFNCTRYKGNCLSSIHIWLMRTDTMMVVLGLSDVTVSAVGARQISGVCGRRTSWTEVQHLTCARPSVICVVNSHLMSSREVPSYLDSVISEQKVKQLLHYTLERSRRPTTENCIHRWYLQLNRVILFL